VVNILLRIREVPGLNLGPVTCYPDMVFVLFLNPPKKIPVSYPILGHARFLPHPFQFSIHLSFHLTLHSLELLRKRCYTNKNWKYRSVDMIRILIAVTMKIDSDICFHYIDLNWYMYIDLSMNRCIDWSISRDLCISISRLTDISFLDQFYPRLFMLGQLYSNMVPNHFCAYLPNCL
jgi:hypothetical protein